MKPMLVKELRQNLKWAIGVLVVMSLGAIYLGWGLTQPVRPFFIAFMWRGNYPFERFQMLSTLGCPLAGLLLGVLHMAAEKRRDLWAFLVHRPISPTTIFLAKATAGLGLYLVAVGVPVGVGTAWLAAPGHVAAPFYWPMALPAVADVLTGGVYYLAALLVTMREARWYGSRTLAVGVAVLCSVLVVAAPDFWMALVAIAVAAGVLGVAAWGSFIAGGRYEPQPVVAKAALGASLIAGIAIAFVVGGTILSATGGVPQYTWTGYQLTADGEVVRLTQDRWGQTVEITDLDGVRREDLERRSKEKGWYEMFLRTGAVVVRSAPGRVDPYGPLRYRQSRLFYAQIATRGMRSTLWGYSYREQLLLAFDRLRKVVVGRLGPDGYTAEPGRPTRRFGRDIVVLLPQSGLLVFPDVVYGLDANERAVQRLYTPTKGRMVLGVSVPRVWQQGEIVVVTEGAIGFVTSEGADLIEVKLEHDLARYGNMRFAITDEPQRYFVWYAPSPDLGAEAREMPGHLIVYDTDGAVLARHELPPIPLSRAVSTWRDAVIGLAVPPAFMVAAFVTMLVQQGSGPFGAEDESQGYIGIVLALLVAVACAVVTVVLARRYALGRGRQWGWGVFNFLVGPAGVLLLWGLRDWPARQACHGCGVMRVVDRDRCEHCDAQFPPPVPDGTEIFE